MQPNSCPLEGCFHWCYDEPRRYVHKAVLQIVRLIVSLVPVAEVVFSQTPAFPGAEGGGMYTRGGRGGRVLEVTSLADDGSSGTLRWAVNQSGARTVVFRISGTILLTNRLVITRDSITIAGQTAPGDGICLRKFPLEVSANQVIIRYIRCRLGDESTSEYDALSSYTNSLTGFKRNIIIDHCSVSWGIDETLTAYGNDSTTVQWCIISESLYHSRHSKGNHGYGGIWGGRSRASFHHNLLAHHSSRNPRLSGSTTTVPTFNIDLRNNVIYNWGFNSAYGGEGGTGNFVNNYYKPGPATKSGVRSRIFQPSDTLGRWYINGNVVEGNVAVTADNWAGGVNPDIVPKDINSVKATTPFPFITVTTHTPQQAFELVLQHGGASAPKRDTVDGRIVHETRTGTVTYGGHGDSSYAVMQRLDTSKVYGIIDAPTDVGGWPVLNSLPAPTDTDHDGMPDAWEAGVGLDPNNASDRNHVDSNGYTMLENYLTSLVRQYSPVTEAPREISAPRGFALEQNYPNPFNPTTTVRYHLSENSFVTVKIFDILGREVATLANGLQVGGTYAIQWDGAGMPSGVYLCRLKSASTESTNTYIEAKKMLLTR